MNKPGIVAAAVKFTNNFPTHPKEVPFLRKPSGHLGKVARFITANKPRSRTVAESGKKIIITDPNGGIRTGINKIIPF